MDGEYQYPDQISSVPMLLDYTVSLVVKLEDYYFFKLENQQSFVTNGKEVYDTTSCEKVYKVFSMGERLCAVYSNIFNDGVVDLKTKEILYSDNKVWKISYLNDQLLKVVFNDGGKNLYDINSKKYLCDDSNYTFEKQLDNKLFSFIERTEDKSSDECKRLIINSLGEVVRDDIVGWVQMRDNFLINYKDGELKEYAYTGRDSFSELTLGNVSFLHEPVYYDGKIIIIENGSVSFYSLNLKLLRKFQFDGLDKVDEVKIDKDNLRIDYSNPLSQVSGALVINCSTYKYISYPVIRIYPVRVLTHAKYYVGESGNIQGITEYEQGTIYEKTKFHFFNTDLDEVWCVEGHWLSEIDDDDLYLLKDWDGNKHVSYFLNVSNKSMKQNEYDEIIFELNSACGYATRQLKDEDGYYIGDKYDLVDMNLNVLVEDPFKKVEAGKYGNFEVFAVYYVSNFVALVLGYNHEKTIYRTFIFDSSGEWINEEKVRYKAFPIDNTIMLDAGAFKCTKFVDPKSGEFKKLTIHAKPMEKFKGYVDFEAIESFNGMISDVPLLTTSEGYQKKKVLPGVIDVD